MLVLGRVSLRCASPNIVSSCVVESSVSIFGIRKMLEA